MTSSLMGFHMPDLHIIFFYSTVEDPDVTETSSARLLSTLSLIGAGVVLVVKWLAESTHD